MNPIDKAVDMIRESRYVRGTIKLAIVVLLLVGGIAGGYWGITEMNAANDERAREVEAVELAALNAAARWRPCSELGRADNGQVYYIETNGKQISVDSAVMKLQAAGWDEGKIGRSMSLRGFCKPEYVSSR